MENKNKLENYLEGAKRIVGEENFDSAFLLLRRNNLLTALPNPELTPMEIYWELRNGVMEMYKEIILANTLILMKDINEDMYNAMYKDAKENFPNFDRVEERINSSFKNEEKVS